MAPLATAEELRTFLKIPAAVLDDARANVALEGVSELVRDKTGRAFDAVEDEVLEVDGNGSPSMLLPRLPVRGVTELLEDPAGAATELVDGVGFEWSSSGIVRRIDGGIFARRLRFYRVTYAHGEAAPWSVKLVVLRVCARAAVNPEGATQENATGYGQTFGFDATRLASLSKPDLDDLENYLLTV